MDTSKLLSIIVGGLFLVWAVLVLLFGGDRYMKWHFFNADRNGYDNIRLKLALVLFLAVLGLWGVLGGIMENADTLVFILSVVGLIILFCFFLMRKRTDVHNVEPASRKQVLEGICGALIGVSGVELIARILDKGHYRIEYWVVMAGFFAAGVVGAILLLRKVPQNELDTRRDVVRTLYGCICASFISLFLLDVFNQKHHSPVTWIILASISVLLFLGPRLKIKNNEEE